MDTHSIRHEFFSVPTDVNYGDKVHGGIVMRWIDLAGLACAMQWSKNYCVTAAISSVKFLSPIAIGNIVRIEAKIIYTGNTSMHISCIVYSKNPTDAEFTKTTYCILVFVAKDINGKNVSVPKWIPGDEDEKRLEEYAVELVKIRTEIESRMESFLK